VNFVKGLFCIHQDNCVIFVLDSIHVLCYIYWSWTSHRNLILNKGGKSIHWRKDSLFTKSCW
jgi:hypothetical protein